MTARSSSRAKPHTRPVVTFFGHMLIPISLLSEVIYSVLILLTFTQAYRLITHAETSTQFTSREYANELLLAALGAILAWGIIDGIMHVLLSVLERSERHRLLRTIQSAETDQAAVDIIAEEFDYMLEPIAGVASRQSLYTNVLEQLRTSRPRQIGFKQSDWIEALSLVLVAILSVLPSLAPFVFLGDDFLLAIRISNTISFTILFIAGYGWGKYTGASPWKTGLILALVGALMVLIAFRSGDSPWNLTHSPHRTLITYETICVTVPHHGLLSPISMCGAAPVGRLRMADHAAFPDSTL